MRKPKRMKAGDVMKRLRKYGFELDSASGRHGRIYKDCGDKEITHSFPSTDMSKEISIGVLDEIVDYFGFTEEEIYCSETEWKRLKGQGKITEPCDNF